MLKIVLKIVLKKSCTKKSARKSAKNSAKKSVALKRVLVKVLKIVAKNRIFFAENRVFHTKSLIQLWYRELALFSPRIKGRITIFRRELLNSRRENDNSRLSFPQFS